MKKIKDNLDITTLPKWELDNFFRYIAEATENICKTPKIKSVLRNGTRKK